jgi:hypothetical protein
LLHIEPVLKGKTKNIKTAAKQRIKRQKTPNKLTSKTPLEPGLPSTTKKNAPEDDHSKCIVEQLGLGHSSLTVYSYALFVCFL